MPSVKFSLPDGVTITPRHNMTFIAEQVKNGVFQPNCKLCAMPVEPTFLGLVISSVETTTPPYAPTSGVCTFDITIFNDTGYALTSLVLFASHDGNGSLSSPTMPTTLAIGATSVVALSYTTSVDIVNVNVTFYVTGIKPNSSTATSNTIIEIVATNPEWEPPEDPP